MAVMKREDVEVVVERLGRGQLAPAQNCRVGVGVMVNRAVEGVVERMGRGQLAPAQVSKAGAPVVESRALASVLASVRREQHAQAEMSEAPGGTRWGSAGVKVARPGTGRWQVPRGAGC